ncbi:protein kinase yak1 [Lichtheimia corymbifera JMRC:FSU:9682]|uniref:Protein kinase yak1 n=1 Tax=Lichtheimia corymbifera JMRC:FSU:9682 TaxID=1263082 RepID=A0A068RPL5_9FUNG|nr:protein kinase yak1 [Lichtheimia corymbifera JMRC:FSU:9682]
MAASASSPSPIRATQHLAGQKQPSSMYYKPSLAPQIKHGSSASSPRKIITVSPPSSATNSFVSLSPPQQSINDHDNRQPENLPLQANWTHHGNTTNGNSTSITQSEIQAQGSSSSTLVGFRPLSRATSNSGSIATVSSAKTITPAMVKKMHYLRAMTVHLANAYQKRDHAFVFEQKNNPRRLLTRPGKPAKNDGYDNKFDDYILRVHDTLGPKDKQYRVIDLLGSGTFGQVVKCERVPTKELVSVKVIKNHRNFRNQSYLEVDTLNWLHSRLSKRDRTERILKLHHSFDHKNHLCIAYELLSYSLYDLLKQNKFRGLPMSMVRSFTVQLLETLVLLKEAMVIHCDLKPENILLKSVDSPEIKVIDYGSACHMNSPRRITYIQSRFYRSPEVILGLPFTYAIDMWSLGCVVAELFLGAPLLPGESEYHQLRRITDMLGPPPTYMLDEGSNTNKFYNRTRIPNEQKLSSSNSSATINSQHHHLYRLKPDLHHISERPRTSLTDLILNYDGSSFAERARNQMTGQAPAKKTLTTQESQERYSLANFLQGLLTIDAKQRWSPEQALGHPFVKGEQFTGPYLPPPPPAIEKPTTTKSPQQSSSTVNVSPPQPSSSLEQSTTAVNSKSPSKNDQKPTLPTPTSPHMIPTFSKDQHPLHKQSDTTTITMPINIVRPRPQSTTQLDRLLGKSTAPVQPSPLSKFHNNASTTAMQSNTTTTTTNTKNPSAAASNKEEKKSSTTNNTTRRVKIAPMVKMRRGSHDSFCMPDEIRRTYSSVSTVLKGEKSFYNHGNHSTPHLLSSNALGSDGGDTTDIDDDHYRTLYGANHFITNNKSSSSSSSGFRALSSRHAGEAAGGLRMMGVHDKK